MSASLKKDSSLISSTNMLKQSTIPGVSQINNQSMNTNDASKVNEDKKLVFDSSQEVFSYLKPSSEGYFKFKTDVEGPPFSSLRNKYKIIFCITIPRDTADHSANLRLTIESIFQNLPSLKSLKVTESDILLCFFLQRVSQENNLCSVFVNKSNENDNIYASLKNTFANLEFNEYLGVQMQCPNPNDFSSNLDCFFITKNTRFNDIEICKLFTKQFCYNVVDLNVLNNFPLFTCFLNAGVMPSESSIKNLILSLYETPKHGGAYYNICSVPSLETIPSGIFGKIQQYEHVHYNIYDLHFYNMTCNVPINTQFCVFKLTKGLLDQLLLFYASKINENASIYYHDNLLSIFLGQLGYTINYMPSIEAFKVEKSVHITDVMYNYSQKLQGHLLLNYDLLTSELTSCLNCNAMKKFLLFFHLVGSLFEFTFPCFCMMVIYAIYFEGFGLTDDKPNGSVFFTGFYAMLTVIYIGLSLSNPNPNRSYKLFLAMYFINEGYTLLTLIVSIPGMHYVRINKNNTLYKFNVAAIVCFIVLNFIFGIIPLLLNVKKVVANIVNMLLYLVMGSPNYTSLFLVHGICNMADSYGNLDVVPQNKYLYELTRVSDVQDHRNKKGIILICYIAANTLLAFFILLMKTRKNRMDCVIALSIIFTIYNAFKMFAIIWSKLIVTRDVENKLTDQAVIAATEALFQKPTVDGDHIKEEPTYNDDKYKMEQNNNTNPYVEDEELDKDDPYRGDNNKDDYDIENGGEV